jgi:hypothetical protein
MLVIPVRLRAFYSPSSSVGADLCAKRDEAKAHLYATMWSLCCFLMGQYPSLHLPASRFFASSSSFASPHQSVLLIAVLFFLLYGAWREKQESCIPLPTSSTDQPSPAVSPPPRLPLAITFQYYRLASLDELLASLQQRICPSPDHDSCRGFLSVAAAEADSIDVTYDAASDKVIVSALWSRAPPPLSNNDGGSSKGQRAAGGWTQSFRGGNEHGRVEVGVLQHEPSNEPLEITLGGHLTVVGDDEKPGMMIKDPSFLFFLSSQSL